MLSQNQPHVHEPPRQTMLLLGRRREKEKLMLVPGLSLSLLVRTSIDFFIPILQKEAKHPLT